MARGETSIGVTFLHDGITEIANGFPVKIVVPCEGTGYEVGSMSIVKGARNLDNAKKFYDWALTPAAQQIPGDLKNFQTPSNKATPVPAGALKMSDLKLINYDFAKYGSAAERRRILEKWDKDVYAFATMTADRYEFARTLARKAGAVALDYWRRREELVVELKGPGDFVSLADREVETLIRREIAAAFPGDGFLGEETAAQFDAQSANRLTAAGSSTRSTARTISCAAFRTGTSRSPLSRRVGPR